MIWAILKATSNFPVVYSMKSMQTYVVQHIFWERGEGVRIYTYVSLLISYEENIHPCLFAMCTCAISKISCTEEDDWAKPDSYQTVLVFYISFNTMCILVIYLDWRFDSMTISYIDVFLHYLSTIHLDAMLELVVSVEV